MVDDDEEMEVQVEVDLGVDARGAKEAGSEAAAVAEVVLMSSE